MNAEKEVRTYSYKVVCAWCKKLVAIKKTKDYKMSGTVSHSICKKCFQKFFGAEESKDEKFGRVR